MPLLEGAIAGSHSLGSQDPGSSQAFVLWASVEDQLLDLNSQESPLWHPAVGLESILLKVSPSTGAHTGDRKVAETKRISS